MVADTLDPRFVSFAVETFGPFLIPVFLFFIGVAFYAAVYFLGQLRGDEDYRAGN